MSEIWEKDEWTSFTIWDIDRAFQQAYDAYEQIQLRSHKKRSRWEFCFGFYRRNSEDDELSKNLMLGRQVQNIMDLGRDTIGSRFEKGDSTCHAILTAQLLRTQQEIYVPILDYSLARSPGPIVLPESLHVSIITAAKAIRRTCLQALTDQFERMRRTSIPYLPPLRLSMNFCPLATHLQKKRVPSNFATSKVRPHDRYDEREICPRCDATISVASHSGLPDARRLLFQSHLKPEFGQDSKFACTSCYKTFDSSYGFLDHVFHKQIGSNSSCQKRWSSCFNLNQVYIESDPEKAKAALQDTLDFEFKRLKTLRKREWEVTHTFLASGGA